MNTLKSPKRKNDNIDAVADKLKKMVTLNGDGGIVDKGSTFPDASSTMEHIAQIADRWRKIKSSSRSLVNQHDVDGIDVHNDEIVETILSIGKGNVSEKNLGLSIVEESDAIKSDLKRKIEQGKELCDKENGIISNISEQIIMFHQCRRDLLREIEELDERQRISQKNITMYRTEVSKELDIVIDVEEKQKLQVPKLKMTISLYASTTGIKWDFADPDLLSGQVDLPFQNEFRKFAIDPRDHSSVETADYLWGLIEGTEIYTALSVQ